MKRSISVVAACFLVFLEFGCDFQNPSDFKTPTWNVNLTLPLIDTFYPLSDIASNDSSKTSDGESMSNIIKSAGDSLLIDFDVGSILIGLPLNEDKTLNRMCQFIQDVVKRLDSYLLKNKLELPIFFWDESYTSFEASDLTYELFKNTKTQKK